MVSALRSGVESCPTHLLRQSAAPVRAVRADGEEEGVNQDAEQEHGHQDRDQPSSGVDDQPYFPIVFRVLRAWDISHWCALSIVWMWLGAVSRGSSEPGLPSEDQEMREGSDAGERGIGDLELLVELFGLIRGETGEGSVSHCHVPRYGFGCAALSDLRRLMPCRQGQWRKLDAPVRRCQI
jgi:hypothetical protein